MKRPERLWFWYKTVLSVVVFILNLGMSSERVDDQREREREFGERTTQQHRTGKN